MGAEYVRRFAPGTHRISDQSASRRPLRRIHRHRVERREDCVVSPSTGTLDLSVRIDQPDGQHVQRKRRILYTISSILLAALVADAQEVVAVTFHRHHQRRSPRSCPARPAERRVRAAPRRQLTAVGDGFGRRDLSCVLLLKGKRAGPHGGSGPCGEQVARYARVLLTSRRAGPLTIGCGEQLARYARVLLTSHGPVARRGPHRHRAIERSSCPLTGGTRSDRAEPSA
jgi:hypothetical protein